MEQLVLLLIIGAISLINWLIEQSGKRREKRRLEKELTNQEPEESVYREPTPAPAAPSSESPRGQEMRRFLESFGIPLPEEIEAPAVNLEVLAPSPSVALPLKPPVIAYKPIPEPMRISPERVFLKSPSALRQAIVWREILGPPRSLQPFEGVLR
jgi:hypothetical protein